MSLYYVLFYSATVDSLITQTDRSLQQTSQKNLSMTGLWCTKCTLFDWALILSWFQITTVYLSLGRDKLQLSAWN